MQLLSSIPDDMQVMVYRITSCTGRPFGFCLIQLTMLEWLH